MDVHLAGTAQLAHRLESWTRELIAYITSNTLISAHNNPVTMQPGALRLAVVQALLAAVRRRAASQSRLNHLPARVLELICRHMRLKERIALSHVSRDIRGRLLGLPGAWNDLDLRDLGTRRVSPDMLHACVARSADQPLLLGVDLYDGNLLPGLNTVARHLQRMFSLSLTINIERATPKSPPSESTSWKATLDILAAPAPRLERLVLFAQEWMEGRVGDTFYGAVANDGSVPLPSTFLAGHAPLLRTLYLRGVRFPMVSCQAFRNVRNLRFYSGGFIDATEVAHAVALMSQLHTLALETYEITAAPAGGSSTYPASSSLRNLILRTTAPTAAILCQLMDFRQLRFLDVQSYSNLDLIFAAFPALCVKRLVTAYTHDALTVEDDSGNPTTTICSYSRRERQLFGMCSAVTFLAVHEFNWPGNGSLDTLPAMPAVVTLCILLATCDEVLQDREAISILAHNEPGSAWHLAALLELCITAPSVCKFKQRTSPRIYSVALADVARFVRLGVQFDAPRLEAVRLAGVCIIDADFCAAWNEMSAYADVVEIVEEAEPIPNADQAFSWDYDIETVFQNRV